MSRVAILGGGISGLSCAYYLTKFSGEAIKQILVLESSNRLGGWIHSQKQDNGAVIELGPRSLRGFGKVSSASIQLAEELGLTNDVIPVKSTEAASRNRFVYSGQQLHVLPSSPWRVIKKSSLLGESLFLSLMFEAFTKPSILDDDTIHNFVSRRFGHKVATLLADPFVRGIYAGDSQKLSMKSCLPDVFNYEQEHGSVVRGGMQAARALLPDSELVKRASAEKWSVWSLRRGLSQLPEALGQLLMRHGDVVIRTNAPCRGLKFNQDGAAILKIADSDITVDHVIAATSSQQLSAMLSGQYATLAEKLGRIEFVTVGVVNIEFPGHVMTRQGFGHLVPSSEPSDVLGVVYDSCAFPQHDAPDKPTTRLTCMMGGAWFESLFGNPDNVLPSRLEQSAIEAVRQQMGINVEPTKMNASIQKNCIPQYRLGHADLLKSIQSEIEAQHLPLHLIGASYHGVSVNDCISHAQQKARQICDQIKR